MNNGCETIILAQRNFIISMLAGNCSFKLKAGYNLISESDICQDRKTSPELEIKN